MQLFHIFCIFNKEYFVFLAHCMFDYTFVFFISSEYLNVIVPSFCLKHEPHSKKLLMVNTHTHGAILMRSWSYSLHGENTPNEFECIRFISSAFLCPLEGYISSLKHVYATNTYLAHIKVSSFRKLEQLEGAFPWYHTDRCFTQFSLSTLNQACLCFMGNVVSVLQLPE